MWKNLKKFPKTRIYGVNLDKKTKPLTHRITTA